MATVLTASLKLDLSDFQNSIKAAAAKGKDLSAAISDSVSKIKVNIDGNSVKPGLRNIEDEIGKTGTKIQGVFQKAFNFEMISNAVSKISGSLASLQEPLIAIDKNARQIGTLGVDNWKALEDQFKSLQKTTGADAAANLDALYDAVSAGTVRVTNGQADLKGAFDFIQSASKLAKAGASDVKATTDALTNVMNAYGLGADKAMSVSDSVMGAVKFGKTTVGEMAANVANVAPIAAQVGLSVDEMNAAIAGITKVGIKTGPATTMLRQSLVELQKPTANLQIVMQKAGVSINTLKVDGAAKTFIKLKKTMEEMGITANQAFSSVEAAGAMNALTTQMDGDYIINNAMAAMKESKGLVNQSAALMNDAIGNTAARAFNKLQGFVNDFLGSLGPGFNALIASVQKLLPLVMGLVGLKMLFPTNLFKDALTGFSSLRAGVTKSVTDIKKTYSSISTVLSKNLNVSNVKNQFSSLSSSIQSAFNPKSIASFVSGVGTGFKSIVTNSKAVVTAMLTGVVPATTTAGATGSASGWSVATAWAAALAPFTPIILAVGAVIALFVSAYKSSDTFRNSINSAWSGVKSIFTGVWDVLKAVGGVIGKVGGLVFTVLIAPLKLGFGIISSVFNSIVNVFAKIFNLGKNETGKSGVAIFFDAIVNSISGVGKAIESVTKWVSDAIDWIVKGTMPNIIKFINVIWNALAGAFNWIKDVIMKVWDYISPFVKFITGTLIVGIGAALSLVIAPVAAAIYGLWQLLKAIGSWVSDVFIDIWNSISDVLKNIGNWLKTAFVDMWNFIYNVMEKIASWIARVFIAVWKSIWDILVSVGKYISETFMYVWDKLLNFLKPLTDFLKNTFLYAWSAIQDVINGLVTAFNWLKDGVMSVVDGFVYLYKGFEKAGSIIGYVKSLISGLVESFKSVASSIGELWDGIKSFDLNKIKNAFSNVGAKASNAFKSGFDSQATAEKAALDLAEKQGKANDKVAVNNKKNTKEIIKSKDAQNQKSKETAKFTAAESVALKGLDGIIQGLTDNTITFGQARKQANDNGLWGKTLGKEQTALAGNVQEQQKLTKLYNEKRQLILKMIEDGKKEASGISASTKSEKQDIFGLYEMQVKSNAEVITGIELKKEETEASRGYAFSASEELSLLQSKMKLQKQNSSLLTELANSYGLVYDESKNAFDPKNSKLAAKDVEKFNEKIKGLTNDYKKLSNTEITLKMKAELEPLKAKQDALKLADELSKDAFATVEIDYELKNVSKVELEASRYDMLVDSYKNALEQQQNLLAQSFLARTEAEKKDLQLQAKTKYNEARKLELEIQKQQITINDETQKYIINSTYKGLEQQKQIELLELSKQKREELSQAQSGVASRLAIEASYNEKRIALLEKYARASRTFAENSVIDFGKTLADSFSKIKFDFAPDSKSTEKIKKIEDSYKSLKEEYKDGKVTYAEMQTKMGELDDERTKALRETTDIQTKILKSFQNAMSETFRAMKTLADNNAQDALKSRDTYLKAQAELSIKLKEIDDKNSKDYIDTLAARNEAEDKAQTATNMIYANMALSIGASLGEAISSNQNMLKSFILNSLKSLRALIPILSAQILGFSLSSAESVASFGIAGIAKWVGIMAGLNAVVSVAEAAVNNLKFEKGGLNTHGGFGGGLLTKQTTITAGEGNRPEFIMSANPTKQYLPVLNAMNKGTHPLEFYKGNIHVNVDMSGVQKELASQSMQLAKIDSTLQNTKLVESRHAYNIQATNNVIQTVKTTNPFRG